MLLRYCCSAKLAVTVVHEKTAGLAEFERRLLILASPAKKIDGWPDRFLVWTSSWALGTRRAKRGAWQQQGKDMLGAWYTKTSPPLRLDGLTGMTHTENLACGGAFAVTKAGWAQSKGMRCMACPKQTFSRHFFICKHKFDDFLAVHGQAHAVQRWCGCNFEPFGALV